MVVAVSRQAVPAEIPKWRVVEKQKLLANVPFDSFPQRLREHASEHPLAKGFLDVTKPPYLAKGDGDTDDTRALQDAIDDAYASQLVVFFPTGTYLVSDGLECLKVENRTRKFGHMLLGSTRGTRRPVLKLKDGSAVRNGVLLLFAYRDKQGKDDSSRHYCATLCNLDIDMGHNADVDAVSLAGAQLCAMEDVSISGDFRAGLHNLPGSGGGVTNVTVTGGRIGVWQDEYRPNPTLTGVTLVGQSECGLKVTMSRGPVIATGFRIVGPEQTAPDYTAVEASSLWAKAADLAYANLCLCDGTIELRSPTGTAIRNVAQDTVLRNVYVKAATIIESGTADPPAKVLSGNADAWMKLELYAFTSARDKGTIYVDGRQESDPAHDSQFVESLTRQDPPADLVRRHTRRRLPSWEDADVADVVTDYGATPESLNSDDDDSVPIQHALDDTTNPGNPRFGQAVFLPRGHYHLGRPLELRKGARLFGAAKHSTVLQMAVTWKDFARAAIETAPDPAGGNVLSEFAIFGFLRSGLLHVRSGNCLVHNLETETMSAATIAGARAEQPYVTFSDGASGSVYNLSLDHVELGASAADEAEPRHHLLLVEGTQLPLSFYQISLEHLNDSPQARIRSAHNVSFYGFKFEGQRELLRIEESSHIDVVGGSGNYGLSNPGDQSLITIRNSTGLFFANLDRKPGYKEIPDAAWILNGAERLTDDRPVVLYRTP
jgi:hypothetical protein